MTDLTREPRTLAHRSDVETSKIAAGFAAVKGTSRAKLLVAHKGFPTSGLTDDEAAAYAGIELHEARRRCSDLRALGLIGWLERRDGVFETRPTASGRNATVSRITQAGLDALGS